MKSIALSLLTALAAGPAPVETGPPKTAAGPGPVMVLRLHDEAASSSLKQRCLYEAAKCHTVTRDAEAYDAVLRRLAAEYRSFPYGLRAAEIVGEVPGVDEHPPSGLGAAPGAAAAGAPRGSPGAQGRPYGWRVVAAGIALLAFLALTVGRLMFSGSRRRKTKGSDRVNS